MNIQDAFYIIGTVSSILVIIAAGAVLALVVKIHGMIENAKKILESAARTKIAGGVMTMIPLLISGFIQRRRAQDR